MRYPVDIESNRARLPDLARRYVWWSPPGRTVIDNLPRLVAQVMQIGTWEDANALLELLGRSAFADVLRFPPPGVFSPKSWVFWHHRLDLGEPPEMAAGRRFPPEEPPDAPRA